MWGVGVSEVLRHDKRKIVGVKLIYTNVASTTGSG